MSTDITQQPIGVSGGIDLTKNENQARFFNTVMAKVMNPSRYPAKVFAYGGAIRGGKTYVCLFIGMMIAKKFPGSRGHVIREDMPALKSTAIPSMEKLIGTSPNWKWHREGGDYYVEYLPNRSRIFFVGENLVQDPQLQGFLGLETNWILMEQIEELSEKMLNKALERVGSWYINPMPAGIIMGTFNPTQTWVKKRIYTPWREGTLSPEYHFQIALPSHNPFVTQEQWDAWRMMDERFIKQFIESDWSDFDDDDNRWAYTYSKAKHVGRPVLNPEEPVYCSWDFNRNPMCCSIIQYYADMVKVLRTYKIKNSGSDDICDRILVDYPQAIYIINGDYSGDTASTLFAEQISNYTIIQRKLDLSEHQIQIVPNPRLEKNRTLVNSVLQRMDVEIHEEDANALIFDLENVKSLADGSILKRDRNDPTQQADALDTFRYFCNVNLRDKFQF